MGNFDMGLYKDFAFTEKRKFQFRSEFFNLMNHPNFGQPNGIGTSPAKDAGIPGVNVDANFNSGMPAFFINGRMLSGAQPIERFRELIDAELAAAQARGR